MGILSPFFRTLGKSPSFTATSLVALALGIGATTAVFSVINTVLLKPLTFPDADRIVLFYVSAPAGPIYGGSATRFNVLREQSQAFEDVSAYEYSGTDLNLTGGAIPEQVHAIRVSEDYFRLFGAPLIHGRGFAPDEDRPNGPHVAVLSYGLWQRHFGGDSQTVGRTISLSGVPYAVVGIIGPRFDTELDKPPDIWLPFQIDPASTDHAMYFNVVGRLKPGVSLPGARAQLQIASDEFRRRFPSMLGPRDVFTAQRYPEALVSQVRSSLWTLAGAVAFVLLIACANVANLSLARGTARKREIAVRSALGASRARIVRQLLGESIALSAVGGALGLALGLAGVRALVAINPGNLPRIGENGSGIELDWRLALFAIGISVISGILFGILPAHAASRIDLNVALNEGGTRGSTGARQNRTHALLVITEVALALVLLIGAALLIRSFAALRAVQPGFDRRDILTLRMSLAGSHIEKTARLNQLIQNGVQHLESLPEVASAAVSYTLPLEGGFGVPFNIVGRTPASGRYDGRGWLGVSPHYFEVFRIPVLRGRPFTERDDAAGARVAIINQALAHKFWPNGNPIGERLLLGSGYGPEFEEPEREIVGVSGDVRDNGLNSSPAPIVYVPMAQVPDGLTTLAIRAARLTWIVRTRSAPLALRSEIASALSQASAGIPVAHVRSMEQIVAESTAGSDFNMTLLTVFGCCAFLLAVIGIYGLMAYSVGQRTQEIGIRLALGAEPRKLRNLVVAEGMRLALAGVAIGILAALLLTRLLSNFLFGVSALDPVVFITISVLLLAAALLAVWFPARRAAATDPLEALRQ